MRFNPSDILDLLKTLFITDLAFRNVCLRHEQP